MNQKMLDALSSTIYAAKLSLRGETVDDDDKRIRASGLYEDWAPGAHVAGEIFNAAAPMIFPILMGMFEGRGW